MKVKYEQRQARKPAGHYDHLSRGVLGWPRVGAAMTDLYDRLTANPPPDRHEVGTEDGETCGRYPSEPDEDAPRGYKPKPCDGVMKIEPCQCCIQCDTCGEFA